MKVEFEKVSCKLGQELANCSLLTRLEAGCVIEAEENPETFNKEVKVLLFCKRSRQHLHGTHHDKIKHF